MARLPRFCPAGLPQHLVQRGNNRSVCFGCDEDFAAYAHWLDEYAKNTLVNRPDLGDLIQGSGGLRKVRWKLEGSGKSSGVRVIYYWVVNDDHIRMLYVYPKGKQENLTKDQLKQLKSIVERW